MKRAHMSADRFRISKPGYDVDTADEQHMLLHESFLYSQPFLWRWVPCPFSGYTGTDNRNVPVDPIYFDNTGEVPEVLTWIMFDDDVISYPVRNSAAVGSLQTGWNLRDARVMFDVTTSSVTLRFRKYPNSTLSPKGAYLILFRRGRDNA